jgi:hypothetical protein
MPLNVTLNFPKRPGFICLEGEARIGISAHLLFQLISHADNSGVVVLVRLPLSKAAAASVGQRPPHRRCSLLQPS